MKRKERIAIALLLQEDLEVPESFHLSAAYVSNITSVQRDFDLTVATNDLLRALKAHHVIVKTIYCGPAAKGRRATSSPSSPCDCTF